MNVTVLIWIIFSDVNFKVLWYITICCVPFLELHGWGGPCLMITCAYSGAPEVKDSNLMQLLQENCLLTIWNQTPQPRNLSFRMQIKGKGWLAYHSAKKSKFTSRQYMQISWFDTLIFKGGLTVNWFIYVYLLTLDN